MRREQTDLDVSHDEAFFWDVVLHQVFITRLEIRMALVEHNAVLLHLCQPPSLRFGA